MTTVGILGGTFDPPHRGHLNIAAMTLKAGAADEVWMMVSPQSPFKTRRRKASPKDRVEMCRLLIEDCLHPGIADGGMDAAPQDARPCKVRVSDFELSLPTPTYTADTLAALQNKYPGVRFRWIVGADNISDFHKWRHSQTILSDFGLIIYPRPGFPLQNIPGDLLASSVVLKDMPEVEASSTKVRILIAQGQEDAVGMMTSPSVARYISCHRLYCD